MSNEIPVTVFLAFSAVTAGILALFPNAFLYVASYGGRLKYSVSRTGLLIVRILAILVVIGIVINFKSL